MLRTLKNLFKQDREKFVVPKSVQNVIPIKTIWEDGIFLVGRNKYARETACSVLSAFSSKYLTIKQELKPAFIFSRSVITKVIATANPCSFTPSSPLMKEEVVILNLFPFFGA